MPASAIPLMVLPHSQPPALCGGMGMAEPPVDSIGPAGHNQVTSSIARTFKCFDHAASDGIGGLVTITGGKATTCRVMAEKTADVVCAKLGVSAAWSTASSAACDLRHVKPPNARASAIGWTGS